MSTFNKAILLGRLGKAPEIRDTSSGKAVTTLCLATDTSRKVNGKWERKTLWHRVVTWDKMAERVERQAQKGSLVFVEGAIRTRNWEDNGTMRYVTEIVARNLVVLEPIAREEAPRQKWKTSPF